MTRENCKISDYLIPLHQFGKIGKIHSVFNRSFNIEIGGQLINLADYYDYLSSFGINLPHSLFQELLPFIQQGNQVRISEEELLIYSRAGVKKIHLSPSTIVSLDLTQLTLTKAQQVTLKTRLEEQHLTNKIGLPLDNRTRHFFEKMSQKNHYWRSEEWQELIHYLIGRGQGLTPSGDDILIAYLLMLTICSDARGDALMRSLELTELATTDVSKAYIISSMKGYSNSFFYQLIFALSQTNYGKLDQLIAKLMAIGHTSGKDLCFGLSLALQGIENEK